MSAQHTPGPLPWHVIVAKQGARLDTVPFNERLEEMRCLDAMKKAWREDEEHRAAIAKATEGSAQ